MINNQIGLSFDLDWQDNEVLQQTLRLLKSQQIQATFFATHKTRVKIKGHELAIHPYFNQRQSFQASINKLLKIFPQAEGLRSHNLHIDYEIFSYLERKKFRYDSNYLMYLQEKIRAFKINNFYELPIYYLDFYQILTEKKPKFQLASLNLGRPGLKIFVFHPIHIYLNTSNLNQYLQYKKDPKNASKYINQTKPGVQTLFLELLAYFKKNHQQDLRLKKIAYAESSR